MAEVDAAWPGPPTCQTWDSGEIVAPVIDSLLTGTHRELPVNLPNAGQCPDLPATSSSSRLRGRRRRHAGRDAHAPPAITEWVRRQVAVQELTVEAAVTGDRRRSSRLSPSIPWPAGATCAPPRPWPTSCWRPRPAGCPSSLDDEERHEGRLRRPGGHGSAHDPEPPGRRPPGGGGLAHPAPGRRRRGPRRHRRRPPSPTWPRPARSSSSASPTPPRWSRWSTAFCPPSVRDGRARLLDHRPRRRAGPARQGGRPPAPATSTAPYREAPSGPRRAP